MRIANRVELGYLWKWRSSLSSKRARFGGVKVGGRFGGVMSYFSLVYT